MVGSDEIVLLEEVGGDIDAGEAFYNQRRPGLGDYFRECLVSDIERLKVYAGVHIKTRGDLHRMKSKRFPYIIYYRMMDRTACVVAVLPVRRKPSWIINMLGGRE